MKAKFDEAKAKATLMDGIPKATIILNDDQKMDDLLHRVDERQESINVAEMLEVIPLFIACLKSYIKREYTEIPVGSILAIISALIYWVSPFDIIPDFIPGIGHIDDAAVTLACLAMVKADLDDYKKWLEAKEN